jgi:hypothetical protein
VLSFVMDGFRTEEIGDYLNRKGIAVRGGHHCAQPILRRFGVESTLRATLALYNTCEEIDALVAALWDLRQGRSPGIVASSSGYALHGSSTCCGSAICHSRLGPVFSKDGRPVQRRSHCRQLLHVLPQQRPAPWRPFT